MRQPDAAPQIEVARIGREAGVAETAEHQPKPGMSLTIRLLEPCKRALDIVQGEEYRGYGRRVDPAPSGIRLQRRQHPIGLVLPAGERQYAGETCSGIRVRTCERDGSLMSTYGLLEPARRHVEVAQAGMSSPERRIQLERVADVPARVSSSGRRFR
jgi:hypothetical protein